MKLPFSVTNGRIFSKVEKQMIWQKPTSHQTSQEELRVASEIKENWEDPELKIFNVLLEGDAGSGKTQLAKALSYELQLPYTKITCFADMDKSDVFGALLPVVKQDREDDSELLEAIYQTESLQAVLVLIQRHYGISEESARARFADLIQQLEADSSREIVQYKYYPSDIVRALEKGYLIEIQEPTVIRDASVLVALNSALENHGMLNLPTGIITRHPDCVVIITTNRNYQGNRPLNESLRDRMQHAEQMDLPEVKVMVQRAMAKTGYPNEAIATTMAAIIRLLDTTAKVNTIKGVAGMRSYFYWLNTVKQGQDPFETIHSKVLYKLTTDPGELAILEDALKESALLDELRLLFSGQRIAVAKQQIEGRKITAKEAAERDITEEAAPSFTPKASEIEEEVSEETESEQTNWQQEKHAVPMESEFREKQPVKAQKGEETDTATVSQQPITVEEYEKTEKEIKRHLNKDARAVLRETIHAKEGLIIHRPKINLAYQGKAQQLLQPLQPMIAALTKKMIEILEKEESASYGKGKYSGQRFDASRVAYGDYRTFDKKNPPHENPSLAVALRIDESGSMIRENRIITAQLAALALSEFAQRIAIPLMIYGDTADLSAREKTSLYSYKEFDETFDFLPEKLMTIQARQNNRDGVPLRILANKLVQQPAATKLLLNISDGQPKAMPDYTGKKAREDIQAVIQEYERQNVIFLAAAIGQDKEVIREIYGDARFLDISDLSMFPEQLLELVSRHLY